MKERWKRVKGKVNYSHQTCYNKQQKRVRSERDVTNKWKEEWSDRYKGKVKGTHTQRERTLPWHRDGREKIYVKVKAHKIAIFTELIFILFACVHTLAVLHYPSVPSLFICRLNKSFERARSFCKWYKYKYISHFISLQPHTICHWVCVCVCD